MSDGSVERCDVDNDVDDDVISESGTSLLPAQACQHSMVQQNFSPTVHANGTVNNNHVARAPGVKSNKVQIFSYFAQGKIFNYRLLLVIIFQQQEGLHFLLNQVLTILVIYSRGQSKLFIRSLLCLSSYTR